MNNKENINLIIRSSNNNNILNFNISKNTKFSTIIKNISDLLPNNPSINNIILIYRGRICKIDNTINNYLEDNYQYDDIIVHIIVKNYDIKLLDSFGEKNYKEEKENINDNKEKEEIINPKKEIEIVKKEIIEQSKEKEVIIPKKENKKEVEQKEEKTNDIQNDLSQSFQIQSNNEISQNLSADFSNINDVALSPNSNFSPLSPQQIEFMSQAISSYQQYLTQYQNYLLSYYKYI